MFKKLTKRYDCLSVSMRASLWFLLANIIQKGMNIISTPIFTRLMTTSEYGMYSLYQSWRDIIMIFATLNVFNYAASKAMTKYVEQQDEFVAAAQGLISCLTVICFLIYYVVWIFQGDILGLPISVMVGLFFEILFVSAFNLWACKERFDNHYKLLVIFSIIMGGLGPIAGTFAVISAVHKGLARIYATILINCWVGSYIYIYNFKKGGIIFNKELWLYSLKFCIPLIPHFLSTQILIKSDRIMIEKMCGLGKTGIYSLAYSVSMLMSIISDAINQVLIPWTYRKISQKKYDDIKNPINSIIVLVAISNLGLILIAPELVNFFATKEYYEAIYIIPPVAMSVYFIFLFNVFANIEYYYEETKFVTLASITAAILNILLNYFLISKYGYIAAGYTTLLCYIIYSLSHFIFMKIVCKKHVDGYKFYNNKFIISFSSFFIIVGIICITLYKSILMRYSILMLGCIFLLKKKKYIETIIYNSNKKES